MSQQDQKSGDIPKRSPMQLVAERQVPDPPSLTDLMKTATTTTSPSQPSVQAEAMHRMAWKAGVIGAFNALAVILAVRLILLVAVIGALILAWTVLKASEPVAIPALVMLAVYCALVVIPVVWLSAHR